MRTPPTARRLLAPGLLLFVVVAWGGSFVAARHLLAPGEAGAVALSPTLLAATRFLIAAAALAPFLPWRPNPLSPFPTREGGTTSSDRAVKGPHLPLGEGRDLFTFLLLGQVGVSLYFWLQYTGVQLTGAGVAAVLVVGLIPLATLLVAGLCLREGLG